MMAADNHTTRRNHQRQPNTLRPVWGADPPHGHCTHAQPPPPTNGAHARKNHRQAPGARTRPRQWVGGPVQALRRLPELGPRGRSGPARVAAAAAPHGGREKFIVFSALCFASSAACCWCRVSCCLFLEMKSFGFDEIQSLQVTPG